MNKGISITVILIVCTYNFVDLFVIKRDSSFYCVTEYEITNRYRVGHLKEPNILLCRCACTAHKAAEGIHDAGYNYIPQCERAFNDSSGMCIEQVQGKMIREKCPLGGYAHCYFILIADRVYDTFDLVIKKRMIKMISKDKTARDLNVNENVFTDINSNDCLDNNQQNSIIYRYFKNQKIKHDSWMEKCHQNVNEIKFSYNDLFVFNDDHNYHVTLWKRQTFKDGICRGDYSLGSQLIVNTPIDVDKSCINLGNGFELKIKGNILTTFTKIKAVQINPNTNNFSTSNLSTISVKSSQIKSSSVSNYSTINAMQSTPITSSSILNNTTTNTLEYTPVNLLIQNCITIIVLAALLPVVLIVIGYFCWKIIFNSNSERLNSDINLDNEQNEVLLLQQHQNVSLQRQVNLPQNEINHPQNRSNHQLLSNIGTTIRGTLLRISR